MVVQIILYLEASHHHLGYRMVFPGVKHGDIVDSLKNKFDFANFQYLKFETLPFDFSVKMLSSDFDSIIVECHK